MYRGSLVRGCCVAALVSIAPNLLAQLVLTGDVEAKAYLTTQDVLILDARLVPGPGGSRSFSVTSSGGSIQVNGWFGLDASGLSGAVYGAAGENGYSVSLETTLYSATSGRGEIYVSSINTRGGDGQYGLPGADEQFTCQATIGATNGQSGGFGGNGGTIRLVSAGPLYASYLDSSGGTGGGGGSGGNGYMQGPGLSAPGGNGGSAGAITFSHRSNAAANATASLYSSTARGGAGGRGGDGSGSGSGATARSGAGGRGGDGSGSGSGSTSGSNGGRGGNGGTITMSVRTGGFTSGVSMGGDGGQAGKGGSSADAFCAGCDTGPCGQISGPPCIGEHGPALAGLPGIGGSGRTISVAATGLFNLNSLVTTGGAGGDADIGGTGGCLRQGFCDAGCGALYSHAATTIGGAAGSSGAILVTGSLINLNGALVSTGATGGAGAHGQQAIICSKQSTEPGCVCDVCTVATGQDGAEGGLGGNGGNITIPANAVLGAGFSAAFCGGIGGRGGNAGAAVQIGLGFCNQYLVPGGNVGLGGLNGNSGIYKRGNLSAICSAAVIDEDVPMQPRGPSGIVPQPGLTFCE